MKPLRDLIWIEVEKRYNDTVEINGQEIFLNPTYNPELHARQHGTVYAVSDKIKGYISKRRGEVEDEVIKRENIKEKK